MFEKRKAAKARAQSGAELVQFSRTLVDDQGAISDADVARFMEYATEHGYGDDATPIPTAALGTLQVGLANRGQFVECESSLLLKSGEAAYCDRAATLLKEVTDREFRGGSRGISVPLGHGVRARAGGVRGHMVTVGTHLAVADTGYLTVTDKRVVYHGGRKTLEFLFTKLATLNVYSDAIDLGVTNRQTTSTFRVDDPQFVVGMIRAAFNASQRDPQAAAPTPTAPTPTAPTPTVPTVHLIEDTHTFEDDDGNTIWCGGLAPCMEDGTFLPESDHRTTDPRVLYCKVAGVSHRREALQDEAFAPGCQIRLRAEPDNDYDANAVQITDLSGALFVGYVPGTLSAEVADLLRSGASLGGQVVREFRKGSAQGERIGLHVLIAPAGPASLTIHDQDE